MDRGLTIFCYSVAIGALQGRNIDYTRPSGPGQLGPGWPSLPIAARVVRSVEILELG